MLWTLLLTSLISGTMEPTTNAECTTSYTFTNNTAGCGKKINVQTLSTNQSSDYVGTKQNITFFSARAIDGNKSTCAHTMKDGSHFWTIDLKNVYNISCFCIYNKESETAGINLNQAEIIIGNRCITIDSFKIEQDNCYYLSEGEQARNVTVRCQKEHLILCEVTIWRQELPFVLIKENMTWEHALYYCRDKHRDLASILNEQHQVLAEAEAREADTPYVWLGLRYTCTLGFWFWIQSYKLEYNNFAEQIEGCDMSVAMSKADGKWYTKPDNLSYNFICTN